MIRQGDVWTKPRPNSLFQCRQLISGPLWPGMSATPVHGCCSLSTQAGVQCAGTTGMVIANDTQSRPAAVAKASTPSLWPLASPATRHWRQLVRACVRFYLNAVSTLYRLNPKLLNYQWNIFIHSRFFSSRYEYCIHNEDRMEWKSEHHKLHGNKHVTMLILGCGVVGNCRQTPIQHSSVRDTS